MEEDTKPDLNLPDFGWTQSGGTLRARIPHLNVRMPGPTDSGGHTRIISAGNSSSTEEGELRSERATSRR